ncbi:Piwi domain-containing protein [Mesorhizobium sp.]|uniref:Piwi domain-containing protein n=1 Tax=Mesorhizobium sp. TaxID=1871066 RepID=UPI0025799B12|nr:Piwi domain-containing protein [Mesorhizobium sp.]
MPTETNIYPISGVAKLSVQYSVYKIIGLSPGTAVYHSNIQALIDRLSRLLKAPVTTIERNGARHIVIPTDAGVPPLVKLVATVVTLKPTGETIDLDFGTSGDEYTLLRQRFLQFSIQSPLHNRPMLWQPRAGQAFYMKTPNKNFEGVGLYHGASLRIVPSPDSGWGLCIDIRSKFVRTRPLQQDLRPEDGKRLVGRTLVYRFGHQWYEVGFQGVADFDVSQPLIVEDGRTFSLLEYVNFKSRKPVPDVVANLDPAGTAIFYRTIGPELKHAAAGLCYLVEDVHTRDGARLQSHAILEPDARCQLTARFLDDHLKRLQLGNIELSVGRSAILGSGKRFWIPSFEFGNKHVLTLSGKPQNGTRVRMEELGKKRNELLVDQRAGFHDRTLLGRQYLVLPASVANGFGVQFKADLQRAVSGLYPQGGPYDPEIITYDDFGAKRSFIGQAKAIKQAMSRASLRPGNALVMIHNLDQRARMTDQLEAMIVKDFPVEFELVAAVIHTDTPRNSYRCIERREGPIYQVEANRKRRFDAYLRNVALSKVLLSNRKIPFVLEGKTHADMVIGIDVKQNTAALSLVAQGGRIVHCKTWSSRQREQLSVEQVANYLFELVKLEATSFSTRPRRVVVHRDGRAFPTEIEGLEKACASLAAAQIIAPDFDLTIVEIKKSGPVTLRLFDTILSPDGRRRTFNPRVGTWEALGYSEGYVCTTGQPFGRRGTARPLHAVRVHGTMTIEDCLADIFSLSCLAWSSPETGTRLPASIKLCDRVLFEDAADYDADELNFGVDDQSEVSA